MWPFSRFFNIIGNVFGQSGVQTSYQKTSSSGSEPAIYVLGTGTETCCQSGDANTASTLMRWGNYDTVNAAVRFVATEVPSGLTGVQAPYANPVPPTQALPASFYLPGKPAWWPASKVWPAIGPDVTGGNIPNVGGHAYTIPAQDCFTTTMSGPANGTGGVLSFNASNCYSASGPAPAAPTNLRIIGGAD
jgi:hypothetical protein